jgi:hypothetical protein
VLFLDSAGCEHLFFQRQGPIPPGSIQRLEPSSSIAGSFSFDLAVPLETKIGHVTITEPASLAGDLVPALTRNRRLDDRGPTRRYGRGLNGNAMFGGCTQMDDCFGARLSLIRPFSSELAVAIDGGGGGTRPAAATRSSTFGQVTPR